LSRIHQLAPVCTPSSTPQSASAPYRCCPLLSRLESQPPHMSWAGPFSPSKLSLHVRSSEPPSTTWFLGHHDRLSCFCTPHGRESLYFTVRRPFSPQNVPFAWRIWIPSNTWFLGSSRVAESTAQTASTSVEPILQGSRS